MRKLFIIFAILSLYAAVDHVVFAQDTAGEIAALQAQIERLRSLVSLASEEVDKNKSQSLQALEGQMKNWQSQIANIDSQITRLDEQIASAAEQQKNSLIQSLSQMLRQKASVEAAMVRLRLQIDEENRKFAEEKSVLLGEYNNNINTLNSQLNN